MVHSAYLRWPQGKKLCLTFSYDDCVHQDERLCEMFKKAGARATFNINSGSFHTEGEPYDPKRSSRRMTEREAVTFYSSCDLAEVACHSAHHGFLERQQPSVAIAEVLEDRKRLEKLFDRMVPGMAYPFGTYDETVIEILRLSGIRYCRTTEVTHGFDLPKNWLAWPATCHHNDPRLFELAEQFVSPIAEGYSRLFYVWGHAFEFDRDGNWDRMEQFLQKVGNREDVWYATNGEIYDYAEAWRALRYSGDMGRVYNPTCRDVWITYRKNDYRIPAGETTVIPEALE